MAKVEIEAGIADIKMSKAKQWEKRSLILNVIFLKNLTFYCNIMAFVPGSWTCFFFEDGL